MDYNFQMFLHLISRKTALERGLTHYFTGKPCLNGHLVAKRVGSKWCPACRREAEAAKNALPEQKAKRAAYDRRRWEKDRDYLVTKNRAYYQKNADAVNAQKREYWDRNREKMAAAAQAWRAENPHVPRQLNAERKRHVKIATPAWADRTAIREVYKEAQRLTVETGVAHHVDHEIPLRGELVCGLHVHNNLRPLPWMDNLSKKNKHDSS